MALVSMIFFINTKYTHPHARTQTHINIPRVRIIFKSISISIYHKRAHHLCCLFNSPIEKHPRPDTLSNLSPYLRTKSRSNNMSYEKELALDLGEMKTIMKLRIEIIIISP